MRKGWFLKIDIDKFYGRNRKKGKHMDGFGGMTTPGRCENCGKNGVRFSFRNEYADPIIKMNLCPRCMDTALHCLFIFKTTPAGRETMKKRLLAGIE